MLSDIPANLSGPRADALDIRNHRPVISTKRQTHFLSIICFDANISLNSFEAILLSQSSRKLWRGWKCHAGEGQVRSRNECADTFLRHSDGCTHHFFMDADVQPTPDHVESLRRHPEAADSIIAGLYCKKQDRIAYPYNTIKNVDPKPNERGLMEVSKAGTGFMQIPRVAYEKIMKAFPERFYFCDYEFDAAGNRVKKYSFFFHDIRMDSELGIMRDQSEDWAFCELARAAGVKIYVDITTTVMESPQKPCIMHRGLALYPLQTELHRLEMEERLNAANEEIARLKAPTVKVSTEINP